MNDSPGWASPGSAPSDGRDPGASGPADRPAQDRSGPSGEPSGPAEPSPPANDPAAQPSGPGPKWSPQQPPPGQWSAPTGPGQAPPAPPAGGQGQAPGHGQGWGAPPPGGPGGYGGYGGGPGGWGGPPGGWGGPPPAAKPGVIPLRPLGVGEILDGAVSTMRTYWRTVLGISLTVAVFTEILVVLLQGLVLDNSGSTDALNDPDATVGEVSDAMVDTAINSGVVLLISLIGTVVATALLTTVTSRAVLGRPVTIGEAWRDARPQLPRLFGLIVSLLLLAAAIVAAGSLPGVLVALTADKGVGAALAVFGMLGAGVVALWIMIRFSLASPALMLEKQGIKKALSRSVKLVRGSWWRVFGIQLLAGVIANIVASIIVIPFSFLAAALSGDGVGGLLDGAGDLGWTYLIISGVGSVIGSMITFPITAGVTVLLYIDQRIRREALDLELARAAGPQDARPGSTPGS
ncbi:glycerophosphoryl diester phosphodiesterase membrane domain-containing protein [Streptomyces sp. NPDC003717]|uniref:DUF7544 domain-containing protein n=1 Tax=Streptomyces sp. NPDC003717 TaxID=3154276 RepID=UPI0033B0551D